MISPGSDVSSSPRGTDEEDSVLSTPQDSSGTYDFTPILTASAVQEQVRENQGTLSLVCPIPTTTIPSPLADNLSPEVIEDIHDYLLGVGGYSNHNAQVYNENGSEVWESWKRAWAIWNNHFIEGRVNEVWLEQTYKKYEAWENYCTRARRGGRRRRTTFKTGSYGTGEIASGLAPHPDPGSDTESDYTSDTDTGRVEKPPVVEQDGSSGGFFAMRDFEEYATTDVNDPSHEFYDPTENSVWRPKRVGEESLKIDMDEEMHEFLVNTDLEFDGGVDCGRSPYPLLRPLILYAKGVAQFEKREAFRSFLKVKKNWDGVRGTIFNMPTGLSEPLHVDDAYSTPSDDATPVDESYINHGVFPLDIRRVAKIPPEADLSEDEDHLEQDNDIIIKPPFKTKQKEYREMLPDDPWWVTEQEREARDVPPRTYPLAVESKQSHLPFDDKLWQDEIKKDSSDENQYFVANLDGRHLIVNGLEIKKGQFAGPLPQFAIIQYEGGGVAFWFGVGGRFYKQADRAKDWIIEWKALRQKSPEWANIGLPTGLVWRDIILAKIREDDEGEGEHDSRWLQLKTETTGSRHSDHHQRSYSRAGAGDPYDNGNTLGPLPFSSLKEELKWVAAQLHYQQLPFNLSPIVGPTEETRRGGLRASYRASDDNTIDPDRDHYRQIHRSELFIDEEKDQYRQIHRSELFTEETEESYAYDPYGEDSEQNGHTVAEQVPASQAEMDQAYNRDGESGEESEEAIREQSEQDFTEQSGQAFAEQTSAGYTEHFPASPAEEISPRQIIMDQAYIPTSGFMEQSGQAFGEQSEQDLGEQEETFAEQSGQGFAEQMLVEQTETGPVYDLTGELGEQNGQALAEQMFPIQAEHFPATQTEQMLASQTGQMPVSQTETAQAYSGQVFPEQMPASPTGQLPSIPTGQMPASQTETTQASNRAAEQTPVTTFDEKTGMKRQHEEDSLDAPDPKRTREQQEAMDRTRMKFVESERDARNRMNARLAATHGPPQNQGPDAKSPDAKSSSPPPRVTIIRPGVTLPIAGFEGPSGISGEVWRRKLTGNLQTSDKQALIDRDKARKNEIEAHHRSLSAARRRKRGRTADSSRRGSDASSSSVRTSRPQEPSPLKHSQHPPQPGDPQAPPSGPPQQPPGHPGHLSPAELAELLRRQFEANPGAQPGPPPDPTGFKTTILPAGELARARIANAKLARAGFEQKQYEDAHLAKGGVVQALKAGEGPEPPPGPGRPGEEERRGADWWGDGMRREGATQWDDPWWREQEQERLRGEAARRGDEDVRRREGAPRRRDSARREEAARRQAEEAARREDAARREEAWQRQYEEHREDEDEVEDSVYPPNGFRTWEEAVASLPAADVVADVSVTHRLPGTERFAAPRERMENEFTGFAEGYVVWSVSL